MLERGSCGETESCEPSIETRRGQEARHARPLQLFSKSMFLFIFRPSHGICW
jgi:hypothetical protein